MIKRSVSSVALLLLLSAGLAHAGRGGNASTRRPARGAAFSVLREGTVSTVENGQFKGVNVGTATAVSLPGQRKAVLAFENNPHGGAVGGGRGTFVYAFDVQRAGTRTYATGTRHHTVEGTAADGSVVKIGYTEGGRRDGVLTFRVTNGSRVEKLEAYPGSSDR